MNRQQNPMMKPVSLEQLLKEETTHVDLYVQLSGTKFVMVAKAGTQTASLARYRDRKVQYLHLRQEDLTKLLRHSMSVAGVLVNNNQVSDAAKVVALEQALSSVYRNFETFGFNDQTVSHARVVTEATTTMCLGHSQLEQLISQMSHIQNATHRHSIMVSAMCSMLGVAMGYTVPATLEKLALGGFLLDIGKLKLPQDIVGKPFHKLNKGDSEIYKSHVDLGVNMAQAIRDLPHDVILMIFEHHEHADGSGYPRKIKDLLMSPMGRVAVVANAFVEQVLNYGESAKAQDIEAVVNHMCNRSSQLYNRDVLRALRLLVSNTSTFSAAG